MAEEQQQQVAASMPCLDIKVGEQLVLQVKMDGTIVECAGTSRPDELLAACGNVDQNQPGYWAVYLVAWNLALQRRIEQLEWQSRQPVSQLDWDNPLFREAIIECVGTVDCEEQPARPAIIDTEPRTGHTPHAGY